MSSSPHKLQLLLARDHVASREGLISNNIIRNTEEGV